MYEHQKQQEVYNYTRNWEIEKETRKKGGGELFHWVTQSLSYLEKVALV